MDIALRWSVTDMTDRLVLRKLGQRFSGWIVHSIANFTPSWLAFCYVIWVLYVLTPVDMEVRLPREANRSESGWLWIKCWKRFFAHIYFPISDGMADMDSLPLTTSFMSSNGALPPGATPVDFSPLFGSAAASLTVSQVSYQWHERTFQQLRKLS